MCIGCKQKEEIKKTRMISRSIDFNKFECVPIYTGRDVKTSRELVSIVETMRGMTKTAFYTGLHRIDNNVIKRQW